MEVQTISVTRPPEDDGPVPPPECEPNCPGQPHHGLKEPLDPRLEEALDWGGRIFLLVLMYLALASIYEFKFWLPLDGGFALIVLWAGAMAGGTLMTAVGAPRLLGMLLAGIILKNAGDPVRDLPDEWAAVIRTFGLTNILMRGGLEMDIGAVKRLGFAVVRLTVLPGVSEAICVAACSTAIFGMPFPLGLALGFILGAVSPAVVVGGMFDLQRRHFGVRKGIPSLVVAAASFDDVVAISGFSLCIGFAIGTGDLISQVTHGPLELILGISSGLISAYFVAMTKLWNTAWKRTAIVTLLGVVFTFAYKAAHFAGAGALASLVMAGRSVQLWTEPGPIARFSIGADPHFAHDVEADLAKIWRNVSEPLLFSVIGSALDFSKIDASLIPSSIGVILIGVTMRTASALFATYGAGLDMKERVFIALAWMPKATVQAALGAVPLELVQKGFNRADDPEKYDRYEQWGMNILTTAVFAILITAPAGLIVIQVLGPRWLEHNDPNEAKVKPRWSAWAEGARDLSMDEEGLLADDSSSAKFAPRGSLRVRTSARRGSRDETNTRVSRTKAAPVTEPEAFPEASEASRVIAK